jgi:hypothetical protein
MACQRVLPLLFSHLYATDGEREEDYTSVRVSMQWACGFFKRDYHVERQLYWKDANQHLSSLIFAPPMS